MESIGSDLRAITPRPFKPEFVEAMRQLGTERRFRAGEVTLEKAG